MEWKDNKYDLNKQIICKDKLLDLSKPMVMGIVNVTPDSFYAGSQNLNITDAIDLVNLMVEAKVDILDVGGVSTRAGADLLTEEEEINRVVPVIKKIRKLYPDILISIDTFRANVACAAVENGADIVNDVYGGRKDKRMFSTVAELKVSYVLMHSRGDASNMQLLCEYEDVVEDVFYELSESIQKAREAGVKDVIIDLGFGFAKDLEQNYELMKSLSYFDLLDCPMLVGISRKSMIYKLFETTPAKSINGTTILNTFALMKNSSIIRVHDVKEAVEVKEIIQLLKKEN